MSANGCERRVVSCRQPLDDATGQSVTSRVTDTADSTSGQSVTSPRLARCRLLVTRCRRLATRCRHLVARCRRLIASCRPLVTAAATGGHATRPERAAEGEPTSGTRTGRSLTRVRAGRYRTGVRAGLRLRRLAAR